MNRNFLCPFCKSENIKLRSSLDFKGNDYDILVPDMKEKERKWIDCLNCDVTFSFPRLSKKQLEYMYENYRSESFRGETPDQYFDRITGYKAEDSENYHKVEWINSLLGKNFSPNKILDIGCGGGVLLHTFKNFFKDASLFGVEPTSSFADLSKRRTGADIVHGYFNKESFNKHRFNLITCCQVLEHVDDLKTFVFDIKNVLQSKGYLYIEVPDLSDFNSLSISHSRFSEPSHLWYFNFQFLTKNLFDEDFSLIASTVLKTVRGRNNLMILLQKN